MTTPPTAAPPRDPTAGMIDAGMAHDEPDDIWRAMYDAWAASRPDAEPEVDAIAVAAKALRDAGVNVAQLIVNPQPKMSDSAAAAEFIAIFDGPLQRALDAALVARARQAAPAGALDADVACTHDLTEREVACADGACPICLSELARQWTRAHTAMRQRAEQAERDAEALRQQCANNDYDFACAYKDAERYRWLRERNPSVICSIAWGVKAACEFDEPDAAIDAARAKLEQEP